MLHMVEHPLIKLQGSGLSVFKQILYDANKFVRCMCIISRLHKCAEKKTERTSAASVNFTGDLLFLLAVWTCRLFDALNHPELSTTPTSRWRG